MLCRLDRLLFIANADQKWGLDWYVTLTAKSILSGPLNFGQNEDRFINVWSVHFLLRAVFFDSICDCKMMGKSDKEKVILIAPRIWKGESLFVDRISTLGILVIIHYEGLVAYWIKTGRFISSFYRRFVSKHREFEILELVLKLKQIVDLMFLALLQL
jgi:hypothetical protein